MHSTKIGEAHLAMTDRIQLRWVPDLQAFYASLQGVSFRDTEHEGMQVIMEGGGKTPNKAVRTLQRHLSQYFLVFPHLVAYKDGDETQVYQYRNKEWFASPR